MSPDPRIPHRRCVRSSSSLAWSAPASAGGPTSAILSVPGEGKTASLYYTDPEYDQLASLVGTTSAHRSAGRSTTPAGATRAGPASP